MPASAMAPDGLHAPDANLYVPRPAEVFRIEPLTELDTLFDVRFLDDTPLGQSPGQFVQVSLLGVGECPISVCSSPTRPECFQLSVRRVGEVTRFIHRLTPGAVVGIRGPLGRGFDMELFEGHDVLVVAGGCALAPARSVIQFILDQRARYGAFHLLYGAKAPSDILFRREVEAWQNNDDVNCLVTVDRGDESWAGRTGLVTKLFDELPPLDLAQTRVVVIGPPIMFKFVLRKVLALGLAAENVFCSLERRMKCGVGKCGHCQVNQAYVCVDGPVFRYSEIASLEEAIE